jgi:hypothetical protein
MERIGTAAWQEKIKSLIRANAFQDPDVRLFPLCLTKILTSMGDRFRPTALGHTGPEIEVHLKRSMPVQFRNVNDLKENIKARTALASSSAETAAPLLLPVGGTFFGVDAVLDSRTFIQFTMNPRHTIAWSLPDASAKRAKNFRKMLCKLGYEDGQEDIRLIVVVPKGVEFTEPMPFVDSRDIVIPDGIVDPLRDRIKQSVYYVDLAEFTKTTNAPLSTSHSPAMPVAKVASSSTSDSAPMPVAKVGPFYGSRSIEREQQQGFFTKQSHDGIMPTSNVFAAIRVSQQIRRIHTLAHGIRKIFK